MPRHAGHVHPDRATLDLPLSDERRAQVLDAARANEWFSNRESKPISDDADVADAITLRCESYDELRNP